jgi:hypothetical protein
LNRYIAPDGAGVRRACNERGVSFTYASEWPDELFEKRDGGTAAQNLRTVSKGSSRGAGPLKKQGRVRRSGGSAENVHLCKHGQRSAPCSSCPAWHCVCPGAPTHVCSEAA